MKFVIAALTAAASLALAAPAHADEASYLAYLHGHGYTGVYPGGVQLPANQTAAGHIVCDDLHTGVDPAPKFSMLPQYPLLVDAAQHELCPDTLS